MGRELFLGGVLHLRALYQLYYLSTASRRHVGQAGAIHSASNLCLPVDYQITIVLRLTLGDVTRCVKALFESYFILQFNQALYRDALSLPLSSSCVQRVKSWEREGGWLIAASRLAKAKPNDEVTDCVTIVIRVTEKVNLRLHCPASCTLRIGLQKYDRVAQAPFVSQPFPFFLSAQPPSLAMLGTAGDSTYPLFPLFSFLACLVVLVPFQWHWRASNMGTCAYMLWTSAACLNGFANSIVWHGKMHNPSPVWCDICTFFAVS